MKRSITLIFGVDADAMQAAAAKAREANPDRTIAMRSASHFKTAEYEDAEEVVVIGDFPEIVDAYEANEVKVTKKAGSKAKAEKEETLDPSVQAKRTEVLTHMPTKESQLAFLGQHKVKVPKNAIDEKIVDLVVETQAKIASGEITA